MTRMQMPVLKWIMVIRNNINTCNKVNKTEIITTNRSKRERQSQKN